MQPHLQCIFTTFPGVAGHYADAGEVAALMALTMAATEDVDMVMTGHSLGRNKLEHLLGARWVTLTLTLNL